MMTINISEKNHREIMQIKYHLTVKKTVDEIIGEMIECFKKSKVKFQKVDVAK